MREAGRRGGMKEAREEKGGKANEENVKAGCSFKVCNSV